MKKTYLKAVAVLMSLIMCLSLLPMSAFAEAGDYLDVVLGGVWLAEGYYLPSGNYVTQESLTASKPNGGYAYMKDGSTLVLHNYSFEGVGATDEEGCGYAFFTEKTDISELNIILEGTNKIKCTSGYGICSNYCDIVISGTGSLDVLGIDRPAIYGYECNLGVSGVSLNALSAFAEGIVFDDIAIVDSTVTSLTNGATALYAQGDMVIMGSTLDISSQQYNCMHSDGTMVIYNSTVKSVTKDGNAINCSGEALSIANSTVTAQSADYSAVYSSGTVMITYSNVSAACTGSGHSGLHSETSSLYVLNSTVYSASENFIGIDAYDYIQLIDSTLTASGGTQAANIKPVIADYSVSCSVKSGAGASQLSKVNNPDATAYHEAKCIKLEASSIPSFTYGDADNDGSIQATDARYCLRASVGLERAYFGFGDFLACDVDGDGVLRASDARLILRRSVGLENSFPVQGN